MDKSEVLKEFDNKCMRKIWTGEDYKYFLTPNIEVIRKILSELVDKMEAEKHEAVSGIIDFISDQDSIIDSTYKTYELLQSDIEYLKNKYLKETK